MSSKCLVNGQINIGQLISDLINTHIRLWHKTTIARNDPSISTEERVALFMKTREFNVLRSHIRTEIDKAFGVGYPDPKLSYVGS